ncbi:MAG: prepilin-type N-terminal cleavage/methylation domain-containing protein [Planctomycetota bacterium]
MKVRSGFSLLEVLLATTILSIGIAALMAVMQAAWTSNAYTEEQHLAIIALSNQTERLKATPLANLKLEFGNTFPSIGPGSTSYFPVFGLWADSTIPVKSPDPATTVPPYPPFNGNWANDPRFTGLIPPFLPGREPALGTIRAFAPTITLPDATTIPNSGTTPDLIEFTLTIEYRSRLVKGQDSDYTPGAHEDSTIESVTIWVSPTF